MPTPVPQSDIDALLGKAHDRSLTLDDLSLYCRSPDLRSADLLNALSIETARRFISGAISYEAGDNIMNGLFTAIVELGTDEEMPQPAFDIYLAFDDGEYHRPGDSEHIQPSERYTKPYLTEILKDLDSAQ
ncbi:hypothetical protein [Pseudomonas mosselii]|uniref:hypothetical protein n=1 Tax=Pseudomonas mosselii TaxID=78327 RepID=UPI000BB4F3B7|nr:hypothetical protein [Pseudomonas mosselii]ATB67561.1 hypothetical protein CLJ08_24280 [Pseudomonas mosselii]MDH1100346.1 hypothetical protein [Pseudomonas mosselii]MEB5931370.1 hypothetical protein [Pseudomonas mosselii]UVN42336.1 hypothetical protein NW905_14420 [Pseudomonas mosselii]